MSGGFNTNNPFAKKYDEWRRREELQRLKDKYGDAGPDESSDDSSSDSDSGDDPMLANPKLQEEWLKTLTALKTKDPRIYQKDYKFFQNTEEKSTSSSEEDGEESSSKKKKKKHKKEKPLYLKDYERKVILEKGGIISSDDEEDFEQDKNPAEIVTYHEEQEELRKSVVNAAGDVHDDESDDDGVGGGLLLKRKRTMHELEEEEEEQEDWEEEQEDLQNGKRKSKPFGIEAEPINTWDIPNLDQRENFLKNFILGQDYLGKDKKRIPTYDEVVYGDEDEETFKQEEEFLDKAEKFEKRHNFRFEEFGGTEVKSYPREIKNLVRRKDTKRTEKRNLLKERKRLEKEKKGEEIKRLKNLKRHEILSKIEKLKAVTGNDSLGFDDADLEEDFDPNKHDEMMQKCFDEDYYAVGTDEIQKPEFEMSDDEVNWDRWTGGAGTSGSHGNEDAYEEDAPHADDPEFCMDADYDPSVKKESRKKMKRKKNKKKLDDVLKESKPVFDPNEKTYEEYIDEYYNMDYEDIIDDIPCRFKYRKVTPNTFGLTGSEILNSNEKELNTWVSLKKMTQYRTDAEEEYDIRAFTVKAKNENLKKRVLHSLYERDDDKEKGEGNAEEGPSTMGNKKKRNRGKKRDRSQGNDGNFGLRKTDGFAEQNNGPVETETSGERTEFSGNSAEQVDKDVSMTDELKVKKKKKKKHRDNSEDNSTKVTEGVSSEHNVTESVKSVNDGSADQNSGEHVSKKKKNKKNKKDNNSNRPQKNKVKISNARLKAYGINPKKLKTMGQSDFKYKF